MSDVLLVLNAGSSSLKFQVFELDTLDVPARGKVTGVGTSPLLRAAIVDGDVRIDEPLVDDGHEPALAAVLDLVARFGRDWRIAATVHRVVHGGERYVDPVIVTPQILRDLEALAPLAPLHQPFNLAGLAAADRLAGDAPDIACFDTAFHAGHAPLQRVFALDRGLRERGLRRYGFHGLSFEWIARELAGRHPRLAQGRVVLAHLGNGSSLCALREGRSIDTTMGMTALDGLPMGTRCGAIDPGVVTYMVRALGMEIHEVERRLYEESGLKGLSGDTNDVAALLASSDPDAAFALAYYAFKAAQHVAAMAVSLGGLDGIVFTGGIGEHAAPVREAILRQLAFLGPFDVLVMPANEERMMAIHARALLASLA